MTTMEYLSIKNLDKYQPQYRDGRKNIWIRWNIGAMRDYKISQLPDEAKWLFIGLICLAVENGNKIPNDPKWIALQIGSQNRCIHKHLLMLQAFQLLVTDFSKACNEENEELKNLVTDFLKPCNNENKNLYPTNNTNNTIQTNRNTLSGKPDLEAPILYLNQKAQKNFDPKNQSNQDLVKARFAEGRTIDQFKLVIDKKCVQWASDEKMMHYLRPSTLFNRTNFENYLNEKIPEVKQSKYKSIDPDCTLCGGTGFVYVQSKSANDICKCRLVEVS